MPYDHGTLDTYIIVSQTFNSVVANNINISSTLAEVRECKFENVNTYTPAVNSAHPTLAGYVVTNTNSEDAGGGISRITVTYTCQYSGTPATSYTEQVNIEKIAIQFNPSYSAGWATSKPNVTDYYAPTCSVTKTEYYSSRPDCAIANVGQLQHPGSDFPGENVNWLIMSATREQQNSFWIITTVFQYADPAWDTDIYTTL